MTTIFDVTTKEVMTSSGTLSWWYNSAVESDGRSSPSIFTQSFGLTYLTTYGIPESQHKAKSAERS